MSRPIRRSHPVAPALGTWSRRALLASGVGSATALAVAGSAGASSSAGHAGASAPPKGAGGSATAEDAISAYLGAMAAADFDGAVAAFAIEPYVERFDFAAMLEWLRYYQSFSSAQPLPSSNPFNAAINRQQRRALVAGQVTNQYFALVNPTFDRSATGTAFDDDAAVEAFVAELEAAMDPARLADLATYEPIDPAELDADAAELLAGERGTELDRRQLAIAGADESAELAVSSAIGGRPVALLFRALRYGDSWWLETLQGILAQLLGLESLSPGVMWLDGAG